MPATGDAATAAGSPIPPENFIMAAIRDDNWGPISQTR